MDPSRTEISRDVMMMRVFRVPAIVLYQKLLKIYLIVADNYYNSIFNKNFQRIGAKVLEAII